MESSNIANFDFFMQVVKEINYWSKKWWSSKEALDCWILYQKNQYSINKEKSKKKKRFNDSMEFLEWKSKSVLKPIVTFDRNRESLHVKITRGALWYEKFVNWLRDFSEKKGLTLMIIDEHSFELKLESEEIKSSEIQKKIKIPETLYRIVHNSNSAKELRMGSSIRNSGKHNQIGDSNGRIYLAFGLDEALKILEIISKRENIDPSNYEIFAIKKSKLLPGTTVYIDENFLGGGWVLNRIPPGAIDISEESIGVQKRRSKRLIDLNG